MRKSITIALAYVGLLVGAGFASGQEVIQYFVAYGTMGMIGTIFAAIMLVVAGAVLFQLGSYFLADDHSAVYNNVSHPNVSRFLDWSTLLTLFCIGFVMLAGAGSNLAQQFDLPVWVGSVIMTVLLIISGFLNVEKLTNVISMITPLLIIAVVGSLIYTIYSFGDVDIEALNELSKENTAAAGVFGNWLLSALNYAGLATICGVSMILVIAGSHMNPRHAGTGGLIGGMVFSSLLVILVFVLFFNMEGVVGSDMPLLMVFDNFHPVVGTVVALIIYAMIYNTAVGMFYGIGRRMSAKNPGNFKKWYFGTLAVGFLLSFVPFQSLVSWVYPVLGYLGIALVAILTISWIKSRGDIVEETSRRERLAELAESKLDPETDDLTMQERKEVLELVDESHMEDSALWQSVQEEVAAELDQDAENSFELADHPHLDPDHEDYTGEWEKPGTITVEPVTADLSALARLLSPEQVDELPDGPVKKKIVAAQGR
ncbi:YkvI family membrane protein [Corynebacterium pilosum]|uniref:Hypothetical membrane protein n=1 Tax=Corynebacterium pilosum TaxID=35756 RepID=A0A376CRK3_9CORY|nr:hypothetical protein [Corynebacterium pilosum]STC70268.1 hypothetical membrane protein [Corynebacterium pilosum]